jgi:hypothetical protein
MTRKNYLFAGSDSGGARAATMYTLTETAKMNGLNPEGYLRDVLARIADHLLTRDGNLEGVVRRTLTVLSPDLVSAPRYGWKAGMKRGSDRSAIGVARGAEASGSGARTRKIDFAKSPRLLHEAPHWDDFGDNYELQRSYRRRCHRGLLRSPKHGRGALAWL